MRLIGAVIVLVCAASSSLLLYCRIVRSRRMREELLYVMNYVKDEISERKTPTEVIFSSLSSSELEACGFYDRLRESGDLLASACGIFSGRELELIRDFSERLGKSCAENQKNELCAVIRRLQAHNASADGELKGKARLCICIPLFVGILAVILFL